MFKECENIYDQLEIFEEKHGLKLTEIPNLQHHTALHEEQLVFIETIRHMNKDANSIQQEENNNLNVHYRKRLPESTKIFLRSASGSHNTMTTSSTSSPTYNINNNDLHNGNKLSLLLGSSTYLQNQQNKQQQQTPLTQFFDFTPTKKDFPPIPTKPINNAKNNPSPLCINNQPNLIRIQKQSFAEIVKDRVDNMQINLGFHEFFNEAKIS